MTVENNKKIGDESEKVSAALQGTTRSSFLEELKRRRVPGSMIAYIVSSWVLVEAASLVLEAFEAPPQVIQYIIFGVVALAPIVLIVSWFFDLTIHGLIRTKDIKEKDNLKELSTIEDIDAQENDDEITEDALLETGAVKRLVTIVQCSIAIEGLDDSEEQIEELAFRLPSIKAEISGIASRYEGYLLPREGEVFTVYFGAELVHEDDTLRAYYLCSDILDYGEKLNSQSDSKLQIALNFGLQCGQAIVEEKRDEPVEAWLSNVGQLIKTTSALQISAEDNEIRLSENVYNIIRAHAKFERVEGFSLPGRKGSGDVYRITHDMIVAESGGAHKNSIRILGRQREILNLKECWNQALQYNGQVVLLRGEAGIGKSSLVETITGEVSAESINRVLNLQCSPYYTQSSLFPFNSYLRNLLDLSSADETETRQEKIEQFLLANKIELESSVQVLEAWLSPDAPSSGASSPEKEKSLLLRTFLQILITPDIDEPTLIVIEDLHWADATSIELIEILAEEIKSEKVMILATYRPTFRTTLTNNKHTTLMNVNRLDADESLTLIAELDKNDQIGDELRSTILERSDGVPLYIGEYTRSILEALSSEGGVDQAALTIPGSLQESLAARLHRLGRAKATLELGATIGREFSESLILACSEESAEDVLEDLSMLMDRDLLYKRGQKNSTNYLITHALIQEAAYKAMLKSRREECHQLVANCIEEGFEEIVERQPEILAQHLSEAVKSTENIAKAINFWAAAAKANSYKSANVEANNLINSALSLVGGLAPGESRDIIELQLLTSKVPVLIALQGYASKEMEETSTRAISLLETVKEKSLHFIALYSVCAYQIVTGQHIAALENANRMLEVTEHQDDGIKMEVYMLLGVTNQFTGNLQLAGKYISMSLEIFDRELHGAHALQFGQDTEVILLVYQSWNCFSRGKFGQCEQALSRLVELSRLLDHPISLSFCFIHGAWAMLNAGREEDIESSIAEGLQITSDFLLGNFYHQALIISSIYEYLKNRDAALIDNIESAFSAYREDGARCFLVFWESRYAEACIDERSIEKARDILSRIEQELTESHELWGEGELLRVKAKLAESEGDWDGAEALLLSSIEKSDQRYAFGLSLMSRMDLAKKYQPLSPEKATMVLKEGLSKISGTPPSFVLNVATDLGVEYSPEL